MFHFLKCEYEAFHFIELSVVGIYVFLLPTKQKKEAYKMKEKTEKACRRIV